MLPLLRIHHLISAAVAALLYCGLVLPAHAGSIDLELRTIYAHQSDAASVDAKLEEIGAELKSSFPGYNTFVLVDTSTHRLDEGGSQTIQLPDADSSALEIRFLGWTASKDEGPTVELARLAMGLADKIGAEVKASPGSVFYQAGLLYEDGILVLAFKLERVE